MKNFIFTVLALILGACCKEGKQSNSYILSSDEHAFIPYVANESIRFKHSNRFEFDVKVKSRETKVSKTDVRHCGDNYSFFETLTVELISTNPELSINLSVVPNAYRSSLMIMINNYSFFLNTMSKPDFDTLVINQKSFYNIYNIQSTGSDTLTISPKQVLYSKAVGIIQITMTNNEQFTINQ